MTAFNPQNFNPGGQQQPPQQYGQPQQYGGYTPAMPSSAPQQAFAPGQMASMFSGVSQARPNVDANYVRPGRYWLRIDNCKVGTSRKHVPFCANEMTVVHVFDNSNGTGHRVGEQVTDMMMRDNDYFLSDIQGFVGHVLDVEPAAVTEQDCGAIYGPEQPLRGLCVELNAREIQTRNINQQTGQPGVFTKISYVREVPATELLQFLPPDVQNQFWPNGALQAMAAHEQQQQRAPSQQQFQPPQQQQPQQQNWGGQQQQPPAQQPQQQNWGGQRNQTQQMGQPQHTQNFGQQPQGQHFTPQQGGFPPNTQAPR